MFAKDEPTFVYGNSILIKPNHYLAPALKDMNIRPFVMLPCRGTDAILILLYAPSIFLKKLI